MRYVSLRLVPVFRDNAVNADVTTTSLIFTSYWKHQDLKLAEIKLN